MKQVKSEVKENFKFALSQENFEKIKNLISKEYKRVFGSHKRIVGNHHDAEDLTQETFARLLTQKYIVGSGKSLLSAIASNCRSKFICKKRREQECFVCSKENEGQTKFEAIDQIKGTFLSLLDDISTKQQFSKWLTSLSKDNLFIIESFINDVPDRR